MTSSTATPSDLPVNILLVDDVPANLLALEAVLDDLGTLVKVPSGEEALRRVLADDFAVILLDVRMKGLDGFETAKLIRARKRSRYTPIVFMTGYDSGDFSVRKAYALGAVDYLIKPLVPEILRAKVTGFVELFRKSEALKISDRQQAAVAELGQHALADTELTGLFHEAAASVAQTLRTEYASIWELQVTGKTLELRAGVGWREGLVGRETLAVEAHSLPGYTLRSGLPVILENLPTETRFREPASLGEHGVVSGMSVVIRGRGLLFGVLGTYARTRRTFTQEDVHFLQAMANVLAAAVERKRAEEQTRLIVELSQNAFVAMDDRGLITDWNRQAEVTFGWSRAEVLQRPLAETILPERYREAHQRGLRHFLATGEGPLLNQRIELPALHRDGHEFPVELTISSPIHWGQSYWFSAFVHDITQRKQVLEELQQTAAELTRSNRELEQFAYVASHDLKEPLRKIKVYLQLLERRCRGTLDEDAEQFLAYAVDAAARLQGLVNDLLTYARVSSQGKPLEPTDSGEAFRQALTNLQTAIQETGAVITHSALPIVAAQGSQLVQLFQNLLANAIKFRGAQVPVIHVEAQQQEREWLFRIRDNGIGIDPNYAERIFVLFERLHNTSDYPGTGIGLAICKKIIERHRGRIWVESELGQGATFCFTLSPVERPQR